MRRAPPLVVQVRPQPEVQAVIALIAAVTAAGLVAWAVSHHPQAWPGVVCIPFAAWWGWQQAAALPRRLRWDGQAWWLGRPASDDETQVRLDVVIDLDHWLLLRAGPRPCWLALSRHQQLATWGALRATLHAARPAAIEP